MVEDWKQVKTRTQRQKLVSNTVKVLEQLVSLKEVGDLINHIPIAKAKGDEEEHSKELYLTRNGLREKILRWS